MAQIPADVKKDDFVEGYGYVLDIIPTADGSRLAVLEDGSVLIDLLQIIKSVVGMLPSLQKLFIILSWLMGGILIKMR